MHVLSITMLKWQKCLMYILHPIAFLFGSVFNLGRIYFVLIEFSQNKLLFIRENIKLNIKNCEKNKVENHHSPQIVSTSAIHRRHFNFAHNDSTDSTI